MADETMQDGGSGAFTQEDLDNAVKEALVGAKADGDKAYKQLWSEAKAAKAKLRALEEVDVDEYQTLKSEREKAEREKAEEAGNFKALETQLIERHQKELAAKAEREEKLTKAVHKRLVQAELTRAIADAKGDATLLLPHAERWVKVRETDDDFEAYVVDEAGQPLFADGQGTPMTFDDLVNEKLIPTYPRAFEGTGSSGGGAVRSVSGAGGRGRTISAGDGDAFMANLEAIAKGEIKVTQ